MKFLKLSGGTPDDKEHYANWVTEKYFGLKQRFVDGDIVLPKDDEFTAQLSTRKYSINSRSQLIIEDKASYKKRIGRSPDRADALILAFSTNAKAVSAPPIAAQRNSYWRR